MKIYLAAAYSRREEARQLADELNQLPGITVAARWLSELSTTPDGMSRLEFRRRRALEDLEDVDAADVLVRLTDTLAMAAETVPANLITGSRMFEQGYAWALGKSVIVVGGVQPIFDLLPGMVHAADVEDLKQILQEWAK